MRDIASGGDILNSTITEIVGADPSVEALQQPAEELAAAEKLSRAVVKEGRGRRTRRALICTAIALVSFCAAGFFGYFWLFDGGKLGLGDLIVDTSKVAVGALITVGVCLLLGIITTFIAIAQKNQREAERINAQRLATIATRWDELKLLGLPKSEMRALRKRS